jgi:NADH:ubiquinone oxidoreductase subunit 6 (subunit J)
MLVRNKEIWFALLTMIIITLIYAGIMSLYQAVPAAGSLFGHLIGVVGFVLMLMTETLYSLRKRSRKGRWGKMQSWLQFHIYTGLVGPFMVLLHTSWKFNGLAGATTLLTVIIVISGFTGRYIYTRIPRSLEGIELSGPAGQAQAAMLARSRQMLATWHAIHIPIGIALFVAAFIHVGAALTYATLLR